MLAHGTRIGKEGFKNRVDSAGWRGDEHTAVSVSCLGAVHNTHIHTHSSQLSMPHGLVCPCTVS